VAVFSETVTFLGKSARTEEAVSARRGDRPHHPVADADWLAGHVSDVAGELFDYSDRLVP
jgi:hypothetical protein